MGMDVYGINPQTEEGKYFRASVWSWRPLWDYCCEVGKIAPNKARACHFNDGGGLNGAEAEALAVALEEEIVSGRAKRAVEQFKSEQESTPLEPCDICEATGHRAMPPDVGPGNLKCNGCAGNGRRKPLSTWYTLDLDCIEDFAVFLRECGGFEVC